MRTLAIAYILSIAAVVPAADLPTKAQVETLIDGASAWLQAQQVDSGAFVPGPKFTLGISGLVTEALAVQPKGLAATDPAMVKALAFINQHKQPNGSVAAPGEGVDGYCTSIALMVWTATGKGDPAAIKAAQDFLFGTQNNEAGKITEGGMGYGSRGKGNEDISNTSFAIAALRGSGVPASDPNLQKALAFLERCQDLSSHNKLPWVKNSGGAVYSPDESKAAGSWYQAKPGEPVPAMAPYGSVTYALISSYLTLDLAKDDPRVTAAVGWITANYNGFSANPGMLDGNDTKGKPLNQQGLFYSYAMAAKAMDLLDATSLTLKDGKTADWRVDLFKAIDERKKPVDGKPGQFMWMNPQGRWAEDVPHLVTAYNLRALKRIHASL